MEAMTCIMLRGIDGEPCYNLDIKSSPRGVLRLINLNDSRSLIHSIPFHNQQRCQIKTNIFPIRFLIHLCQPSVQVARHITSFLHLLGTRIPLRLPSIRHLVLTSILPSWCYHYQSQRIFYSPPPSHTQLSYRRL